VIERTQASSSPRALELRQKFRSLFGNEPRIFRAPGRVNLIGDHTDYNDGFVLPVAVNLYVWVAIAPRADSRLVVHSINFNQRVEFVLEELSVHSEGAWSDYVRGVAYFLSRAAPGLRGANLVLHGEVPMGAGLSSSAACEVGVGYSLERISGFPVDLLRLAKIGQRAEHELAGTRCGIMDQLICCCAGANSALFLDCRSLEYEAVPLFPDTSLVVCDSKVKHAHAAGEYNARRSDCESGARMLSEKIPGVRALRDVSLADLERWGRTLPETIYKRCRHVVAENARVREAVSAMRDRDADRFGSLMYESHRSLRDDFEVSCAELDLLVDLAAACEGVYGSRMTGGGFGGCTVSLVKKDETASFVDRVSQGFEERAGSKPAIHVFNAVGGVEEVRDGEPRRV
jgi:galactokinase